MITVQEAEKLIYPLAKAAEDAGRWELMQGILLTTIAVCNISEEEQLALVAKLNVSIANQLIEARKGNQSILAAVGLTKEKLDHLETLIKSKG